MASAIPLAVLGNVFRMLAIVLSLRMDKSSWGFMRFMGRAARDLELASVRAPFFV